MHIPVLLQEAIDGLSLEAGDIFIDGTLGNGGHTEEVLRQYGQAIRIIAIDRDSDAIARSRERLAPYVGSITFIEGSFRNMDKILQNVGIDRADGILLDLGLSSDQFEESGRGFSFQKKEPLLMTFSAYPSPEDLTAREIVNTWDEENIRIILQGYGEEQFARRIARSITAAREIRPIETTEDLVEIIMSATPAWYHHRKIHPATKTFQALRIAVNDEIESLKEGLAGGFGHLASGGRMAVISFHSLEDRMVKHYFKEQEDTGLGRRVTKRPITASEKEVSTNPRSRSAKLRIIEKTK